MGNGAPFNVLCCNLSKDSQIEDVDINKNSKEYNNNYKTIKVEDRNINNEEIKKKNDQNNDFKKFISE